MARARACRRSSGGAPPAAACRLLAMHVLSCAPWDLGTHKLSLSAASPRPQLRVGNVIEHNGKLMQVVSLQNRAMGVSRLSCCCWGGRSCGVSQLLLPCVLLLVMLLWIAWLLPVRWLRAGRLALAALRFPTGSPPCPAWRHHQHLPPAPCCSASWATSALSCGTLSARPSTRVRGGATCCRACRRAGQLPAHAWPCPPPLPCLTTVPSPRRPAPGSQVPAVRHGGARAAGGAFLPVPVHRGWVGGWVAAGR